MSRFDTVRAAEAADEQAPDGLAVRWLVRTGRGSLAHFTLEAGRTSSAVMHRSVEEIWYFLSGTGEMWRAWADGGSADHQTTGREDAGSAGAGRAGAGREEVLRVAAGVSVSIPPGCRFQLRAGADQDLTAVAVTMPPWPGDEEAEPVTGPWTPSVGAAAD